MDPLHIYTHTACLDHDTSPGHPESVDRLRVLLDLFAGAPFNALPQIQARKATRTEIARAHDERYIAALDDVSPAQGLIGLDGDTILSPGSLEAAYRAAGAACQAVEAVMGGEAKCAFCATRPPGHHAEPDRAMGFCLFNTVFIGARHAQEACGAGRVAIVDFDVHHGNGTETMTRRADDIFYISSHQTPLYPMTGDPMENVDGQILNMTLKAGDGGRAFRSIYGKTALPALEAFRPDLIMISAGFDAHRDDPLAGLMLEDADFGWITEELVKIADRHAQGRIVSVLEGGYNLEALRSAVAAHLMTLIINPSPEGRG